MTPLAHKLMKRFLSLGMELEAIERFARSRMFELSDIYPELKRLGADISKLGLKGAADAVREFFFLPSGITWFEYKHPESGERLGLQCDQESDDGSIIILVWFEEKYMEELGCVLRLTDDHLVSENGYPPGHPSNKVIEGIVFIVLASLISINMKDFIELTRHPTHKGLAKAIAHINKGHRPEMEWHTVTIKRHKGDASEHDYHPRPGGQKRLHFCRAHLRLLPSKRITRVKAHWRGHKELGTLMTDYRASL